jgi:hypothetical protein
LRKTLNESRQPGLLGDLGGEVVLLLLEALAQLEAHEAADLDVLAELRDQRLLELIDRLVGVLHERLVEEADVLQPLGELALDHLLRDRLGLARLDGLGDQDGALARDHVLGDLFAADELRAHRGDLHRDVPGERDEVVVASDEVGLAVDLDQHADAAAAVDVRHDRALGGLAAGLLGGLGQALGAQVVDRLVHVGVALDERLLAVRHAGAGALAQVLDHVRGDFSHDSLLRLGQGAQKGR